MHLFVYPKLTHAPVRRLLWLPRADGADSVCGIISPYWYSVCGTHFRVRPLYNCNSRRPRAEPAWPQTKRAGYKKGVTSGCVTDLPLRHKFADNALAVNSCQISTPWIPGQDTRASRRSPTRTRCQHKRTREVNASTHNQHASRNAPPTNRPPEPPLTHTALSQFTPVAHALPTRRERVAWATHAHTSHDRMVQRALLLRCFAKP